MIKEEDRDERNQIKCVNGVKLIFFVEIRSLWCECESERTLNKNMCKLLKWRVAFLGRKHRGSLRGHTGGVD